MSVFRRVQVGELMYLSAQDNITAHAGGGQALAFNIGPVEMTRVTTVATVGDSIALPPAQPGLDLIMVNHGANSMQVFGQPGDTINDVSAAVGVAQMVNSFVIYSCFTPGAWYTEGLANGFAGGFQTFSSTDGLVAKAGGGQAGATPIVSMQNLFSTVASAGDSALLPPSKAGMQVDVVNKTATSMNVFPATGEQINGGAANASVAVAGNAVTLFFCGTAGQWWTK